MTGRLLANVSIPPDQHAALLEAAAKLPDGWAVSVEPVDATPANGPPLGLRLRLTGPRQVVGMRLPLGCTSAAEIARQMLVEVDPMTS